MRGVEPYLREFREIAGLPRATISQDSGDDVATVVYGEDYVSTRLSTAGRISWPRYTEGGLRLRLDAPALAYQIALYGVAIAEVVLPHSVPHPYRNLVREVEVGPAEPTSAMGLAVTSPLRVSLHYRDDLALASYTMGGPVGVRDLHEAVLDSLVLAEGESDDGCESSLHDLPDVDTTADSLAPHEGTMRRSLMLEWHICERCAEQIVLMGAPLAPPIPKEW